MTTLVCDAASCNVHAGSSFCNSFTQKGFTSWKHSNWSRAASNFARYLRSNARNSTIFSPEVHAEDRKTPILKVVILKDHVGGCCRAAGAGVGGGAPGCVDDGGGPGGAARAWVAGVEDEEAIAATTWGRMLGSATPSFQPRLRRMN
jgi:hypothetical protein